MTGRKKTEKERTAEIYAPFHEAAKRIEEAAKSGAWGAKPTLRKVTEIVGRHEVGFEWDVIVPSGGGPSRDLSDMLPTGTFHGSGRWRITVEFEPEEER